MAYVTNEIMKEKREAIKTAFPSKDGWKFSIRKIHHSTISVSIMQYPAFYNFGEYEQVNHYHINGSDFGAIEKTVLNKLNDILHVGHWDKSDMMTDYFNCAWYMKMSIGQWDKPAVKAPK